MTPDLESIARHFNLDSPADVALIELAPEAPGGHDPKPRRLYRFGRSWAEVAAVMSGRPKSTERASTPRHPT